jgi:hypothetical protein
LRGIADASAYFFLPGSLMALKALKLDFSTDIGRF